MTMQTKISHFVGVWSAAGLAVILVVSAATPALAADADVAAFYKGKNITWLSGFNRGGYARTAEVVSRFMHKYIPGKPGIDNEAITTNGGIDMANHLYTKSKRDGTVIGIVGRDMPTHPLIGHRKTLYDVTKMSFIGNVNGGDTHLIAWHKSGFTSLKDINKRGAIRVGTSRGNSETFAVVANNMLTKSGHLKGGKIVVVAEYPSMLDVVLAMKRGDLDGMAGIHMGRYAKGSSFERANRGAIAAGKVKAILRYDNLKDMVSDPVDKQALQLIFSRQKTSRIYVLPPGVPPPRVAALRKAFMAAMKDPEFIREAKGARVMIEPMGGAELQARIAKLYAFPKAAVERAQWAIKTRPTLVKAKPKKAFKATITGKKRMRRGMRKLMLTRADGSKATAVLHPRRSRVTIGGKRVRGRKVRRALKDGIICSIAWSGPGGTAMRIDCP